MPRKPAPDPFASTHFVNGEQTLQAPAAPRGKPKSSLNTKSGKSDVRVSKNQSSGVRG